MEIIARPSPMRMTYFELIQRDREPAKVAIIKATIPLGNLEPVSASRVKNEDSGESYVWIAAEMTLQW